MVSHEPKSPFEQRSKALFDEGVDGLSGNIRSRLTQARHRALEQAESTHPSRRAWWAAAGVAAVALLAVAIVPRIRERGMPEQLAAEDLAMLVEADDLELIENIEFYAWVEENMESIPAETGDATT